MGIFLTGTSDTSISSPFKNVFAPFGKFRQNMTKCQDKNFQRGFSKLSRQLYPILSQKWPKNGFSTSFLGGGPKNFLPGEALSGREKNQNKYTFKLIKFLLAKFQNCTKFKQKK